MQYLISLIHLRNLNHINLFNCRGLDDSGLKSIADNCNVNLEYFNIEEVTRLSDDAVCYFLDKLQHIIKHLLIDGESLSEKTFRNFKKCKKLETLKLTFAEELKSAGLASISTLSGLRVLRITRAKQLQGTDFIEAFKDKKLKLLTDLDLSECAGLSDDSLVVISSNCVDIQHLCLAWCWELTDTSVHEATLRCQNLQTLDLTGIVYLTSNVLRDLSEKLPSLTSLNLQQCPDIDDCDLTRIMNLNPELKLINYYGEQVYPENK